MYHAMGYSSILVMQAGMTFEEKDMEAAMTSLRESLQTCEKSVLFNKHFPKHFRLSFQISTSRKSCLGVYTD